MGKINSREKGARGEREFASILRSSGYEAERGCQHSGGKDSPDVKCNMPGVHWEVKYVEKLNIYTAMEQSRRDAADDEMPLVAHRRNRTEWLVTMPLSAWLELFRAWENERRNNNGEEEDTGR